MLKTKFLKRAATIVAVFLFGGVLAFADETPIENLYSYKLKNGMELFVAENHTVPLTYIEIAIRGGGIGQTKENAGLFHLYEHMMFKGNSKYKNNEEMQAALTELGVAEWNGSTGLEYVNYYFTIPSSKLQEGLEFWNAAIRTPKMDKREFEAEKKVVLSEIEGDANETGKKVAKFMSEKLFPEEPWVRSPGGTSDVVSNATVAQLKAIQKSYYIPNNAALFVGGDVNPAEVYELVNKIYGSWKKGKDPWLTNTKHYTMEPLTQPEIYVVPYDQVSPQIADVEVYFRGPDAEYDREDTYATDMLLIAVRDPQSYYKQSLINNQDFVIPAPNYCWFSYLTSRRLGIINAGAVMLAPDQYLAERAIEFSQEVYNSLTGVLPVDSPLTEYAIQNVHQQLYNSNIYEQETAAGLLSTARFWWCCADTDYFYSYDEKVKQKTAADVSEVLDKYIKDKNPLILIYINPDVYEQTKENFKANNIGVYDEK